MEPVNHESFSTGFFMSE